MKAKLITLIFLTVFVNPNYSQHVDITHLHDFVDLGYPTGMLLNANSDLVQIRNEWGVAVFTIYDTSNYQVLSQVNPSNQSHGGMIINNFMKVIVHKDSGYLVTGAIPLANNSFSTPIIYWLDENANVIKSYQGSPSISSDLGERPVFGDIFTRSDGHIIALYSAMNRSAVNDTGLVSVVYEFDNLLNPIGFDTIGTNSAFQMSYNQITEEIILIGSSYSNNPWSSQSNFSTIDAFSFNQTNHIVWPNSNEYISGFVLDANYAFVLTSLAINTPKYTRDIGIYKFNLTTETMVDSLIFSQDSLFFESQNLEITDGNLFFILTETDIRKDNSNKLDNHFIVLDDDLSIKLDSVINDSSERYVSSQYFTGTELFFNYGKNTTSTSTYVFMKISLDGITSVNPLNKNGADWLIYPNPTSGIVTLNIPISAQKESLQYQFYNMMGSLIETNSVTTNTMDISILPKGLYIFTVSNNNQVLFTSKISKI